MVESSLWCAAKGALSGLLLLVAVAPTAVRADESLVQAIKQDRERIKGTWRVAAMEDDGEKTKPEEGEVTKVVNDGEGVKFIGIYALNDDSRKLCIDPFGKTRPKEFAAPKGSKLTLFFFEREKTK